MGPRKDDEVSLKEHYEDKLASIEKLQDERWLAHKDVHSMGQLAIDASVKALDARLEAMNQFRAQISEERGEFVKHEVYASERKAMETKFDAKNEANEKRFGAIEGIQKYQAGRAAAYASVVAILSILLQILLHFVWK